MKKFNISFLLILIAAFAFTSAQAQKSAVQKTEVKSKSTTHQPAHVQNAAAVPAQKDAPAQNDALVTDGPVLNDAVINVKDEKQYLEQKKEKEKKNIEKQTDTPK